VGEIFEANWDRFIFGEIDLSQFASYLLQENN